MRYPKGSEWRLWDLHIHTPFSVLNNQFPSEWDQYVQGLFKKAIEMEISAIGITDYYTIDGYKKLKTEYLENHEKLNELFTDDEIAKIDNILILPNIEFRINKLVVEREANLSWNRKINFHLLLSDELHIDDIEQNLLHKLKFEHEGSSEGISQSLTLTVRNLTELGKSLKEQQPEFQGQDDLVVGMLNASVDDTQLINVLNENHKIFKGKYLTAIYSDEDLSRISWTSQGHLTRKVLIQKSHLIFSANPNTIDFALGKRHNSQKEFKEEFKSLKPCIWSSDAHNLDDLFQPDSDRFTWIKADPTFEGLKSVVYEPEDRVQIQKNRPDEKTPYLVIDKVKFVSDPALNLFSSQWIEFNQNLNTIIGGKSSGKSLLLYHLAKTISPEMVDEKIEIMSSGDYDDFREKNPFDFEVLWKDGTTNLLSDGEENKRQITFIPQLYINHLAEEKGERHLNELVESILERNEIYLVFRDSKNEKIGELKTNLSANIITLLSLRGEAKGLSGERNKIGNLNSIKTEIERLAKVIADLRKESGFSYEENKEFDRISANKIDLQNRKENLTGLELKLDSIAGTIDNSLKSAVEEIVNDITNQKDSTGDNLILSKIESAVQSDLAILKKKYTELLTNYSTKISNLVNRLEENITTIQTSLEPYNLKIKNQEKLRKEIDNLQVERKKVKDIQALNEQLRVIIKKGKKVNEKIINDYEAMFACYKEIRDKLNSDKFNKISDDIELLSLLEFDQVAFNSFSNSFDGRTRFNTLFYSAFDNNNEFNYNESNHLSNIRIIFDNLRKIEKSELRLKDEYNEEHLYKTLLADYFKFKYVIKHKGDDILKSMSPGKRGVVLLELILHLSNATHPILIDQPEDNLDNRTIYDDLKEFIKTKKIKRQIIIATHNANLVVATDAENIIGSNQDGQHVGKDNKNFKFEYVSGSLENTFNEPNERGILYKCGIKEHVCDILEGGQEAFEKRKEKYGFK